jgi:aspartyl-tRNA(Asn)/glutamyl-tRNA(Gln) amidotransferase subunit A
MSMATTVATEATSVAADGLPLTLTAAAAALRAGDLTAVGLLEAVTARAEKLDPLLGTYIVRTDETARAAAEKADQELASGLDRGLLHGMPLGIKDIISTADAPSTAQSLIMRPEFGEQGDAVVVSRLRAAGAVLTGKLTTMEYAIGCPDPSKGFPTPRNPFNPEHYPGGSSSGTGSGVTAGMFLGGLGTDTGGSIRLPAAWCGISGMKQTFGRVPKSGCAPLGFSYDHIGPMTRSARDAAAMLSVLAGHDESDACSVDRPVDDYVGALTGTMDGLRVGVDLSFLDWDNFDPSAAGLTRAAVDVLGQAGGELTEVSVPFWNEMTTAMMLGIAEAFTYHHNDMQTRWNDYGLPTRMAVGRGLLSTAADFVQAQRVRRAGLRVLAELYRTVDLVVMPTVVDGAPKVEGLTFTDIINTTLTGYWNAAGYPAISIPMGLTSKGLPVGLQIVGRPFEEATVFRAADAFQQRTDHHLLESPFVLEALA